jgi:hypothetical protein
MTQMTLFGPAVSPPPPTLTMTCIASVDLTPAYFYYALRTRQAGGDFPEIGRHVWTNAQRQFVDQYA